MSDKLDPERSVRLLRAITGELETAILNWGEVAPDRVASHLAVVATLLADFMERIDEGYVEIGDPLFNEDGTPWKARPLSDFPVTPEQLDEAREWRHQNFPGITDD